MLLADDSIALLAKASSSTAAMAQLSVRWQRELLEHLGIQMDFGCQALGEVTQRYALTGRGSPRSSPAISHHQVPSPAISHHHVPSPAISRHQVPQLYAHDKELLAAFEAFQIACETSAQRAADQQRADDDPPRDLA